MAGAPKKKAAPTAAATKKKSPARKAAAAAHPELGRGARYLLSAAAGYASGTIVAHDGREATVELASGGQMRWKVGEYELTRHSRQRGR